MTDFKKIFHLMESIDPTYRNHLINEISIIDKYNKEKEKNNYTGKGIDFDTFEELCNIDPTTKGNNVGKYCNWLIAKYNPNTNLEKLKYCLNLFNEKRNILSRYNIPSDINSFKTYEELIETINNLNDNNDDLDISSSEYNNRNKLEGQFEVLGSNSHYDIIAPQTFDAERYFGGNTEWCTVANNSYFSDYMKQGQLYILYPKNGDSEYKMQFHFESNSFADKYDDVLGNPIDCIKSVIENETISNELIALCKKVFAKNAKYMKHFLSPEEVLKFVLIELKNGVNPEDIFDDVGNFYDEGLAKVKLKGVGYNFINTENKILRPDLWFDNAEDFRGGIAKVYIYGDGFYCINTDGKILRLNMFDKVEDFHEGFALVKIEGKGWNFINTDGKILRDDLWFNRVWYFKEGFAMVKLRLKYNFINTDGKILRDDLWFDRAHIFFEGFATVKIGDNEYKIDTNGILYDLNGNRVDIPVQESKKYKINWLI